ncbi:MAG TPA: choice-of-anchor I family protein, partial [Phormidium sp.]
RLFVTNANANTIDVLSISDPTNPSLLFNIDLNPYGGGVNSVAYSNNMFAIAVENAIAQDPGNVVFFDASGKFLNSVTVGALPDMLTFTPDGKKVLVANEGEPNSNYTLDPEGSVSIIDLFDFSVKTASFNGVPVSGFVRQFGPNATLSQDLEPEYITVSADGKKAWVTLQENNALGILDIAEGKFEKIVGLGFKDHSLAKNSLDASDKDNKINITTYPNLFGMYQPDAIASYTANGKTYLVTANEGDSRDYDAFSEEARIKDLLLDPTAFPNAAELQTDPKLGRLQVTNTLGDTDGDGDFDELYAFGGRSFSIWDESGNLVFDSGDAFEKITAERFPEFFNASNDDNQFDSRSDNKGPEPEGLTVAQFMGRTYAFIGLERIGGVMVYDISDPVQPVFIDYVNSNRNFLGNPKLGTAGDLGPEGLLFITAKNSPKGNPLLVLTNEVSGSTTIYSVSVPEPSAILGLLVLSSFGLLGLKR